MLENPRQLRFRIHAFPLDERIHGHEAAAVQESIAPDIAVHQAFAAGIDRVESEFLRDSTQRKSDLPEEESRQGRSRESAT